MYWCIHISFAGQTFFPLTTLHKYTYLIHQITKRAQKKRGERKSGVNGHTQRFSRNVCGQRSTWLSHTFNGGGVKSHGYLAGAVYTHTAISDLRAIFTQLSRTRKSMYSYSDIISHVIEVIWLVLPTFLQGSKKPVHLHQTIFPLALRARSNFDVGKYVYSSCSVVRGKKVWPARLYPYRVVWCNVVWSCSVVE